ncbi:MAG TPA: hypothetical protein VF785_09310, partial [Gemmatimonadaceae bacterium]
MTQLLGWLIGIIAVLAAALLATADSALLAFHALESSTVSDAAFADRERRHRALAMGRVLAYVAAGAALAQAIHLDSFGLMPRAGLVAIVAVVVCTLAECVGRAIGYADPSTIHARLDPVIRFVGALLSPAVALGAAIDRALHAIIPTSDTAEDDLETSTEQFREVVAAEADV